MVANGSHATLPKRRWCIIVLRTLRGKTIPYSVYDMGLNEAWGNVGRDRDTPVFAVASIRRWWGAIGWSRYRDARALYITADVGGSNGYRARA